MATVSLTQQTPVPWWVRSGAPWYGDIFNNMALQAASPREQRIQAVRDRLVARFDGKRRLSLAQARLVTAAYQETEGLHPALRQALAMARTFHEIPLGLLPGQLLMGTASSGPNCVDFNPQYLFSRVDPVGGRAPSLLAVLERKYLVDPEDRRLFDEEIWPYWRTRTKYAYFSAEMERHYPEAWHFLRNGDSYEYVLVGALHHTIQDYASILAKGLEGIKREIRGHIAELDATQPDGMATFERRNLYDAMLIAADGLIDYARRNAEYAAQLAVAEPDPQRRAELLEMARICRKVPAQPAESWWEALQSLHFLRAATALAEGGDSHAAGRFDQYMLPYLERDLESGVLDEAGAQELLECLFLKWNEAQDCRWGEGTLGVSNNDKITIGGTDAQGRDCSNRLSYMLLEAHAHVHLNDPNLSLRVHRHTPERLLRQSLEVVRLGGGLPILINDEVIVPALVGRCGVALADARHYGDIGCQENATDPNLTGADTHGRTNAGWFSIPKPFELALNNGVNPRNSLQVGPSTGDPRTFVSMEQFLFAARVQMEHAVATNALANNVADYVSARYYPCVFHDLLHSGPRASGIDINAGGCRYNWTGALCVGMATAGDLLSAIDRLVFQTKSVTWDELLPALAASWEGADELRRRCLAAPKYGTDDEYADGWTRRALDLLFDAYERHHTPRGGHFVIGLISMGLYVPMGRKVGATPDGRRAGEPLSDSISPSRLAPAAGPTAAHRSAARAVDTYRTPNGVSFNQRFSPGTVATTRDIAKWADLLRTYFDAGGQEAQYNITDQAVLQRAQVHPEEYRDLIVRVGGYSALFVELTREAQDTIIARTEQEL
jgi:pyruvate formate-lyase/glycerol dehydratase family glycyl radical enzyme